MVLNFPIHVLSIPAFTCIIICIYIYLFIYRVLNSKCLCVWTWHAYPVLAQVNVELQHVMSFEKEGFKREFILDAHLARKDPNCHIFDDVATLSSERKVAFCHSCSKEHEIPSSLDVLFVGPSCKDISKCNPERESFHDCPLSDYFGYFLYALRIVLWGQANCGLKTLKPWLLLSGYSTGSGTSGSTYQNGVVGAVKRTSPVILFFENVLGVAERKTSPTGNHGTPLVEARPGIYRVR